MLFVCIVPLSQQFQVEKSFTVESAQGLTGVMLKGIPTDMGVFSD